ncbi:GyrI-like domain-containing protein [Cellulomonas xiejunii]|uniref:GyrI-like domain-containing protein n=1 Tax=Cellulomonas xiejunii TaxID=2968083 RepID=A0ABY5KR86_9CELL|nr:GyrI-like domain-containing protein [Cellulomonas xiejunii]MCC2313691.1 GyrI-like domain-containing protein [Cellulomonas xiejunii]MCC2321098.1 GyrI-like domain-containing protein [Cellulomonas xiejunii]UUI71691.1 GyrI-like domain-containing protein [Cellulomonas xiejunii]
METTRTDLNPATIAAVRATVPMPELTAFYDSAYDRVTEAAGREGWTIAGPAFGWYHSMPTDMVDLTAGFVVEGAALGESSEGVEVTEMPGGAALVLIHTGSYDGLSDAWSRLEQERAALGLEGRGDFWEEYVTDPAPDGDPDLNITRLVLPLRVDA